MVRLLAAALLLFIPGTMYAAATSGDKLIGAQALLASLSAKAKVAAGSQADAGASSISAVDDDDGSGGVPPHPRRAPETDAQIRKLKNDVAAFGGQMAHDTDAGAHWAALFDHWFALQFPADGKRAHVAEVRLADLLDVLPAPKTWPRIAEQLRAHHSPAPNEEPTTAQLGVLTLADKLVGDTKKLLERRQQIERIAEATKAKNRYGALVLGQAAQALESATAADDSLWPVTRFAAILDKPEGEGGEVLHVPDLVTLAGAERARALLEKALVERSALVEIPVGAETRALAAQIALAQTEHLRAPQWGLVRGLDCAPLYEALVKRFGDRSGESHPTVLGILFSAVGISDSPKYNYRLETAHNLAKVYYFAALIAHGQADQAARVAGTFGDHVSDYELRPVFDALERAGHDKELYTFLDAFLAEHPNSDLWQRYLELAARSGQQDAMLAHVRATLAAPKGHDYASTLRTHLIDALLAADKIDEAVAELRTLTSDSATSPTMREEYALKLGELGRLYSKPEWVDAGLAVEVPEPSGAAVPSDMMFDNSHAQARLLLLRRLGRYADAERLLAKALVAKRNLPVGFGSENAAQTLTELAGVYHAAGRDADVLTLLDRSPDWGVTDVAPIAATKDIEKVPLGYYAAVALHKAGKDAQALPLLEAVIDKYGGFDPAYALYTQIGGGGAIAYLDQVYVHDQFEERPLIWKASLLFQAKHYVDAERVARAAIAVDPSDGEEGPGDRMRAYAVLADVLQARGDTADATLYRNAVQAIRDSEHADEFRLVGAHAHAIEMYTKALDRFADAYCIQSRLAVELNARGNTLLAEEHYRRAYELMPTSFGRMESHCLGCENVFGGATAQTIAERVFGDLLKSMPGNPQVHYLFGYLREEQERYADALSEYRVAANLDKDYLNAWKRQSTLDDKVDIPVTDRDLVSLRLYELDPQHRHTYANTDKVVNWAALYTLSASLHDRWKPAKAELYKLAQSKLALARSGRLSTREFGIVRVDHSSVQTAGRTIARTQLMLSLSQLMESPLIEY